MKKEKKKKFFDKKTIKYITVSLIIAALIGLGGLIKAYLIPEKESVTKQTINDNDTVDNKGTTNSTTYYIEEDNDKVDNKGAINPITNYYEMHPEAGIPEPKFSKEIIKNDESSVVYGDISRHDFSTSTIYTTEIKIVVDSEIQVPQVKISIEKIDNSVTNIQAKAFWTGMTEQIRPKPNEIIIKKAQGIYRLVITSKKPLGLEESDIEIEKI